MATSQAPSFPVMRTLLAELPYPGNTVSRHFSSLVTRGSYVVKGCLDKVRPRDSGDDVVCIGVGVVTSVSWRLSVAV